VRHDEPAGIGRLKNSLSAFEVEAGKQHVRAGRRQDREPAVDQRALAGVPERNLGAITPGQADAPPVGPVARAQAKHMALRPDRDHGLAVCGGHGA